MHIYVTSGVLQKEAKDAKEFGAAEGGGAMIRV